MGTSLRGSMMATSTRVKPPNSLVLVEDSSGGELPTSMNQSLIAATASCVAVGCRSEDDGETEIVLGHCSGVDTGGRGMGTSLNLGRGMEGGEWGHP